jgi:predicted AAA+ superfamily ATPase
VFSEVFLIDGARQVGKTYIIRHVGEKLFSNYIEINMVEDSLGARLFAETKSVEGFYLQVSMLHGDELKQKENTMIFMDEIQAYPHLLTLLKFLSQDNRFTYIAKGAEDNLSADLLCDALAIAKARAADVRAGVFAGRDSKPKGSKLRSKFRGA